MEDHQRAHIEKNLATLVLFTSCTPSLLDYLSNGVLTQLDVSRLDEMDDDVWRTNKLFDILFTKVNSYQILCEALEQTNQTRALEVLRQINSI
ncbi:hypothetical protein Ocin01_17142 [Orchesella cincta]|uniref:Uncharacterized protein n=1 Tax=Orchesella cincta TaxID=48709 RepID=A0A1D2M9C4_ORCCI|nr:hypothetical protein Ocin01_17142 [Orchesella cincta]